MELFEQIVRAVNEELGISDLVTSTYNTLLSLITKDKKKKPLFGNKKSGDIPNVKLFGKTINLHYELYFVKTMDEVESIGVKWPGGYNDDTKSLVTTLVYVKDENKYVDYAGTLQHEIEHLYQTVKTGKPLLAKNKTRKIYNTAKKMMDDKDYYQQIVGYSIYYASRFEGDAYANGYYRLIHDNWSKDPMEIIKSTKTYKNLMIISKQVENMTPYTQQAIENICVSNFGKHFNWWNNLTKKMINTYLTKIGKVIAKAEKEREEYLTDPQGVIKPMEQPPKFVKEDE